MTRLMVAVSLVEYSRNNVLMMQMVLGVSLLSAIGYRALPVAALKRKTTQAGQAKG